MIKINLLPQIDEDYICPRHSVNDAFLKNFTIRVMLPCMPQYGNRIIINDYTWQKTYEKWAELIKDDENPINSFLMDFAEHHREINLSKWKPIDVLNYFFHGKRPDFSVNERIRDRQNIVRVIGEESSIVYDTRADEIYIPCYFVDQLNNMI